MRRAHRGPAALVVAVLLAAPAAGPLGAQSADEIRQLRRAASLEVQGRYADAREILEGILEENPTSSAALFSLERVLRPVGSVRDVLPWADRYLEREPRAAGARYLVLRILSEVDSVAAIEPAVLAWVRSDPGSAEPYREGARLLEERFGAERALALLRRGRDELGETDALSLELGDVLHRTGEPVEAAEEWARAVAPDGSGSPEVLRRVERLADGPADDPDPAVETLLDRLGDDPTTPHRRRAGVRIAVTAGMAERAVELAEGVVPELEPSARRAFLSELARDGEEAGLPTVSLWAWTELAAATPGDRERQALNQRIAASALAAADTAAAVSAQLRLARSLEPGSPGRRKAVADLIRVEAHHADAGTLRQRLEGFRSEFPDAPELDELASTVAAGLRARGQGVEAAEVLEDVRGPRSSLERAYLLFEDGSVDEGLEALLASVGGLDPSGATDVIQLGALLERLPSADAATVARSAALAHRGATGEALEVVREAAAGSAPDHAPALLAHGARLADDAGRGRAAAELRERLLREHPDASESAEAGLALARWHARTPEGLERAVEVLEELILARPNSPIVPAARRELDRLRSGGADGGGAP